MEVLREKVDEKILNENYKNLNFLNSDSESLVQSTQFSKTINLDDKDIVEQK